MKLDPVFREGIQIQIAEGHGFAAYVYLMILFAPIVFLALFLPSLDTQVWIGPAELFKVSSVAAFILIAYFALRVASQEFAPWRYRSSKRWRAEENVGAREMARAQLALLALQVLILVLLAAPLLAWAAAIARVPLAAALNVFFSIFLYALVYGVWGLAALALWERKLEVRQVFVRAFFIGVMILSAALYLPLNPIAFLLAYLDGKELAALRLWRWRMAPGAVHFIFHAALFAGAVAIHRRALGRED